MLEEDALWGASCHELREIVPRMNEMPFICNFIHCLHQASGESRLFDTCKVVSGAKIICLLRQPLVKPSV